MIYHLLVPLQDAYGAFRVFRYISFRALMAMLTALAISLLIGPLVIRWLRKRQVGESIRSDGPSTHQAKSGTPTMGGVFIIMSLLISTFLWSRLDMVLPWIVMAGTLGFAAIGFVDDSRKLLKSRKGALSIKAKLQVQTGVALVVVGALTATGFSTQVTFPFFKDVSLHLPWPLFVLFGVLVVVGASNAVNLTDGLDGLAIGPMLVAAFAYVVFTYVAGHARIADYLQVMYVPGAGELAVFCGAIVGAGLGFLWFNAYPAQVFMGDVGSLALGAALGLVAVAVKQEILLVLVGGVFVMEAVSVIVQVFSFRTTGKRVFRMAPVHHHFELKGWAEPKVIVRFWIVSIVLALLALATLKLR